MARVDGKKPGKGSTSRASASTRGVVHSSSGLHDKSSSTAAGGGPTAAEDSPASAAAGAVTGKGEPGGEVAAHRAGLRGWLSRHGFGVGHLFGAVVLYVAAAVISAAEGEGVGSGLIAASVLSVAWAMWVVLTPSLGKYTAYAATLLTAAVLVGGFAFLPRRCPSGSGARCTPVEAAQLSLVSIMLAGIGLAMVAMAAIGVRALFALVRVTPRVGGWAARVTSSVERRRRERRDSGVRWFRSDWKRDPIIYSGIGGGAIGAILGWFLGGSIGDAALWAGVGVGAFGVLPGAWRSGGAARELRVERAKSKKQRRKQLQRRH